MKRKILRIFSIVFALLLLLGTVTMYFVSASIYRSTFDYRCTTGALDAHDMANYPAMDRSRHTFPTLQGHTLVGYLYQSSDGATPKALVVFAHGLGAGGQTGYLDIFDVLVRSGYCVFAYDATGNDESEGEAIGGLPQGFIDMDYAADYAQALPETQGLPLILMGYSWGGLSAANTLNTHPEAAAVVALAGWNRSLNLIEYEGRAMVGDAVQFMLPFVTVYEFFTYGDYAFSTAMKGFAASDCGVMIVHGERDITVPPAYGYDLYHETYGDDPRFTFLSYPTRGHQVLSRSDGKTDTELLAQIIAFCDQWVG